MSRFCECSGRCQEVNHLWGGSAFEEEVNMTSWRESTGKYIPTYDYQRYAYSVSRATSSHLLRLRVPLWLLNGPNLSEFGLLMYIAAMSTVASFIVIHATWT